ncbi:MAG: 4-alpha-glucanotransferase [Bacteroidota bacterium]
MELKRSSGILIHITSLPSPFGIGDMGPEAYEFIDFLEASGHKYWQILPLNPTDAVFNHSPYSSDSAFAGNTLLISPELLEREGKIDLQNFELPIDTNPSKVDFETVVKFKKCILDEAFVNFKKKKNSTAFKDFCKKHASWLDDYSLYKALRKHFGVSWDLWPETLRDRKAAALNKARKEHVEEIEKTKYFQFLFFSQWNLLSDYAHLNKVNFIGDIPFYINHDSADCWANTSYFKLDKNKKPAKISGVPPDYFSETGQLWGTPVYNWKVLQHHKYDWWLERIRQNLLLFDLVRLDHFRAFSAYWEVDAGDKTAENGKWVKSPGNEFFEIVQKKFPEMPLIAEDLGSLDESVYKLIKDFNFPGMKVLQFAFGEERVENTYLPFNHLPNNFVYTGTHDNNTSRGWFEKADRVVKRHFRDYVGSRVTSKNIHLHMHRMALNSVARVAIIPMQDIIGLGGEALMNIPGSTKGNWTWRVDYEDIPLLYSDELKAMNELYGRSEIPAYEKPLKS